MISMLHQWLLLLLFPLFLERNEKVTVGAPHPFYISVTEINHSAADKALQISCKFFAEDFEDIIDKNYQSHLDIAAAKDKPSFNKYIPDYIGKHLVLMVDSKPAKLAYIGYEKENESAYCYFEVVSIPSVKKLDITNSLLHDFTDQQINIVHVTVNGKRQSTKLDYP